MDEAGHDWGASVSFDDPELIPDYLIGKAELMEATPEATVRCDSILVCRISGGKLDAIACDHPRHGCHPKLREQYAKVRKLMSRLRHSLTDDGPCPKCEGKGWLETNSPEARHLVLLSLMMGMWRGISFTPRGLSSDSLGDTVGAFLSSDALGGASSSPAGVAALGRALFNPEKATGKGEGK